MKGLVALTALKDAAFAYDKLYAYAVPPELYNAAKPGCRVLAPFGRGNLKKQGMIMAVEEAELKGLKILISVTDDEPVLNAEMLGLCAYMHDTVFCTYFDAISAMLPAGLSYKTVNFYSANPEFSGLSLLSEREREVYLYLEKKGETAENTLKTNLGISAALLENMCGKEALLKMSDFKRRLGDATQKWVRLGADEPPNIKLTPRQKEVYDLLGDIGSAAVKEICYFTGVSASVIDNLVKKGLLVYFEKPVYRTVSGSVSDGADREITLTDEQQAAYEGLLNDYNSKKGGVSLLYGITGSGKTRVFLKLADKVIAEGRGVMVMVPEISLTPQLISIFTERYGQKIAVFHSAMSMGKRLDEWKRIRDGKALIAIGTRSAIFAPFKNPGLIIIDEEQEHTYKSEKSPRYHARELARYRMAYNKGLLCLSSATPSIESYTLAKKGVYSMYTLHKRYGNAILPIVETVDMKAELNSGNRGILSNALYDAVKDTLAEKKQVILLLNRRGYNTYVSCPSCGYVEACPNCSVSLTYHSANNRLMCHYCGYSKRIEKVCPECKSAGMKFTGYGTQKAEAEIKALFPDANILRLDADSTLARDSYAVYLSDFAEGKYDILIGTQMVAKGLNFPNVTLVGVIGADRASYSEDFRSFERSFSLLAQVVGRAGRGEAPGRAIIQTADPESSLIELAKNQDYDSFYNEEILTRKLMVYPPYCDICLVTAFSTNKSAAENAINAVFSNIKALIENEYKAVKLIILGPTAAAVPKVNNRYRMRIIIKCKNNTAFREMLRNAVNVRLLPDTSVSVDMNPETII